jgi:hypothetical protein
MLGKLAEAYVEVSTRNGPFDKGLAVAETRLRGWVGKASGMASIPLSIGGAVGLGLAGRELFKAVQLASDLGETQSKVAQVFKDSTGAVSGFADEMASKFGLVKREVLDAASAYGLILNATGMTADESAQLSIRLARVAADASSFYNIPMAEALEKIRSGIVGETEPMRALGVLLDEGAVKQYALANAIGGTTGALDTKQKTAVRAELILKGLATASGDLERTQDSLSNQQRKLSGEWENLQTQIGAELIPVAKEFVGLLREMSGAFGDLEGASAKASAGGLAGTVAAMRQMVGNTKDFVNVSMMGYLSPLILTPEGQRAKASTMADIQGRQVEKMLGSDPTKPLDSALMRSERARLDDLKLSPEARATKEAEAKATKDRVAAEEKARRSTEEGTRNFMSNLRSIGGAVLGNQMDKANARFAMIEKIGMGAAAGIGKDPFEAKSFGSQTDVLRQLQLDILGGDDQKQQTAALKDLVNKGTEQVDLLRNLVNKGIGGGMAIVKGKE